jgi:hypothetical protein
MSSTSDRCKYQTFVLDNIASNLPFHKETMGFRILQDNKWLHQNLWFVIHTSPSSEYHARHGEFICSPRMSNEYSVEVTGHTASISPLKIK